MQGYAESARIVICNVTAPPFRVPFKIAECTSYEDKRLPSYFEMRQIAWEIRSKSAGHTTGFVFLSEVEMAKQQDQQQEQPQEVPAAASHNE